MLSLHQDPSQSSICNPPGSRLFIVCGRSVEEATLQAAFAPFGTIQNIKLIKEKGVCYVKFDRASSAAAAMEALNGAVLNNGRGPKLKVLLAEAPTPRGVQAPPKLLIPDETASADPDNVPPRSRLFLVVPKTAEARVVHEELSRYPDMEYCKTDLIASKGCVFVKYSKASSALRALEEIAAKGMLSTYKVKVMLAEPKTKRTRPELSLGLFGMGPLGHLQGLGLDPTGQFGAFGLSAANSVLAAQQAAALQAAAAAGGLGDYGPQGLMGFGNTQNMAAVAAAAAAAAAGAPSQGMEHLGGQMGLAGFGLPHQGQFMPQQMGLGAAGAADQAAAAAAAAAMGGSGMPPPPHLGSHQHAAHAAAAAAAAAAAGGQPGAFQPSSSAGNLAAVSSSLTNVNFGQLGGPFMGLSGQGGSHGGSSAGLMTSAGMQQMQHMQQMQQAAAAAAAHQQQQHQQQQHQHQHDQQLGQQLGGPPVSQQRLFVVVHKSVSEDQLRLMFRQYPGCEYCDLKRDKLTGRSKGYCYVNYSTPAAAAAAQADLNGVEYPVGSGFRLKVMYAEIMTGSNSNPMNGSSSQAAALLRSSSSRSSLSAGGQQGSGALGPIMRASSGNLTTQGSLVHTGSSGALAAAAGGSGTSLGGSMHGAQVMAAGPMPGMSAGTPMAAMGAAGTVAGSTAGSSALLSPAGSDPNSSSSTAPAGMGGGLMGSAGPSPAASPLCDPQTQQAYHHHHHQQQQQQSDIARVTDRLSSLSLPNMSAPSPQHTLSSIGSEHSNDLAVAAAAAAAAQHYSDLKANSAASLSNSVARELMFNMS